MDLNSLGLFLKMLQEEYRLTESQKKILTDRMLADAQEFEKVWKLYRNKSRLRRGDDPFKLILQELLT